MHYCRHIAHGAAVVAVHENCGVARVFARGIKPAFKLKRVKVFTGIISLSHVLTSLLAAEQVSYKCLKLGPITFFAHGVFVVNKCLLGLKRALNAILRCT